MDRLTSAVLSALIMLFLLSLSAKAEYKHAFTGAAKCRVCHMSKKKGNQHGIWKEGRHAKAYLSLTTDEAKAVAEKAGQGGKAPQENPACLKCHVTAWDAPAELLGSKYSKEEGIGCESCHGPGKDYSPIKIMKDQALAVENGLIFPEKEDCLSCHNKESPTYKPFDFDTFWAKMAHDNPLTE